jgi:translation elongation factor EF-Tu-like GTPase
MAWFRHKNDDDESMDPQVLLARADAASPAAVSIAKTPTAFRMTVSDVFSIQGRGTVVTGTIETGAVDAGDTVRLTRADGSTREVTIDGIEAFRKVLKTASAGAIVGLLVRGLGRDEVTGGDVLTR